MSFHVECPPADRTVAKSANGAEERVISVVTLVPAESPVCTIN